MDGIDFRKICQGDHFFGRGTWWNFLMCCHLYTSFIFVDGFTWNFEKLSVIVNIRMKINMHRIAPQKNLSRG
jgi:hypothetical protein